MQRIRRFRTVSRSSEFEGNRLALLEWKVPISSSSYINKSSHDHPPIPQAVIINLLRFYV